ncbi:MAG: putative ABC transporter permease [Spirochaetaceae bacterium]|jgi:uncharacterized membrane protein|nr:putative ABC transporter permease [Spirochaetaceae bacterium]
MARLEEIVFMFFFFSVSGWAGESIMESIVRKRFVSKGVFKGPYVPVHGVGVFAVYLVCTPLKEHPVLVFLAGVALCTGVEYLAALFLEKVFHIRGWDYDTYPFTKWCNYKKRIALTTSLFFGLYVVVIMYFYWDVGMRLFRLIGETPARILDILFSGAFLIDVFLCALKYLADHSRNIKENTF